jgi:hypothetical protein
MRRRKRGLAGAEDPAESAVVTTLFDIVRAMVEAGATDTEVVTTLSRLMHSGRVKLIGEFQEHHLQASQQSA